MSYIYKDGKLVELTSWMKFKRNIINFFTKWRLVNKNKYKIYPYTDSKYYFKLTKKEYEDAEKLYKEKGTISYEFYPCGGIGWGTRIHILDTGEVIDITDYENF